MKPRDPDDAIPLPIGERAPARRRMPAGTAPLVRVAEGTVPVRVIPASRLWLRFTIASVVVLAIATIAAYLLYVRAARREALEAEYPVLAGPAEASLIDQYAARWAEGEPRLLRALAAFEAPRLDALVGAGACRFTGRGLTFTASADLVPAVRESVAAVRASAERGRFATDGAVSALVDQLTGPIVVTAGRVRYAFDPATGALACAGTAKLRAVQ